MKVIKYLPILAICMMTTGCNSSKQQTLTSGIDLANLTHWLFRELIFISMPVAVG